MEELRIPVGGRHEVGAVLSRPASPHAWLALAPHRVSGPVERSASPPGDLSCASLSSS